MSGRLACAVAAVALIATACGSAPNTASAFEGHRWRVVEIKQLRAPAYDLHVPADKHAWIEFGSGHQITAYNLVSHQTSAYVQAGRDFLPTTGGRGDGGWVVDSGSEQVADAIDAVIFDRYHPVAVARTSLNGITMTASYHSPKGDTVWHPTVVLVCEAEPR